MTTKTTPATFRLNDGTVVAANPKTGEPLRYLARAQAENRRAKLAAEGTSTRVIQPRLGRVFYLSIEVSSGARNVLAGLRDYGPSTPTFLGQMLGGSHRDLGGMLLDLRELEAAGLACRLPGDALWEAAR